MAPRRCPAESGAAGARLERNARAVDSSVPSQPSSRSGSISRRRVWPVGAVSRITTSCSACSRACSSTSMAPNSSTPGVWLAICSRFDSGPVAGPACPCRAATPENIASASTSIASSRSATWSGWGPRGRSNTSDSECAGSVETISTRLPSPCQAHSGGCRKGRLAHATLARKKHHGAQIRAHEGGTISESGCFRGGHCPFSAVSNSHVYMIG